jgi:DNA-binding transcriptional MerR regulator
MATRKNKVEEHLGLPGAARYLNVAESTARRYADTGVIPATRDHANRRVFRVSDLESFAASRPMKTTG